MTARSGLKELFTTLALPGVCLTHPVSKPRGFLDRALSRPDEDFRRNTSDCRPVVAAISSKSPVAFSGLKVSDIICAIEGRKLDNAFDLLNRIRGFLPGNMVAVTVIRDGSNLTLQVPIGYRSAEAVDL